ncbi:PBP family protein [Segatella baroniae F0067]|uniref:PBP family protein n=1 Tax=Segatella baroniae F0067 TaxID=1115809 RepID=U2NP07_9BACT|nr:substrate-binding domain-containing protein [Segatella baroniae]ERK39800.1 PBP family protein [Segatella baroniae F0067]
MKKRLSYVFVGLTLSAALLASCANKKPKDGRTDTYSSGAMSFASDESFSPVIEEERELFEFTYPKAKITPIYTNESEAINKLLAGKVFMAITSRDFKPAELQNLKDRKQFPRSIKFAYDGLALIQNNLNVDSCISVNDIKRILLGEVTRWNQIYPKSKMGEITVVFDNPKSSSVHFVEDSILGGKPITGPNVVAVKKTVEVINYVEKHKGAIGIVGSNWLNDKRDSTNLMFKKEIRPMAVTSLPVANVANSWKPFQYYFYNGNYPLVRTLYILLNDTHMGLPTGFSNFIISQDKGQRIVLRSGLLPAYGNLTIRNVHVTD